MGEEPGNTALEKMLFEHCDSLNGNIGCITFLHGRMGTTL